MTGVMDLKHILCQPAEERSGKQGFMVMMHPQHHHPLEYNENYREHTRSISTGGMSNHRISRSNSMNGGSGPYTLTPRKRVHSEHHRTSPLLTWGYQQPSYQSYYRDEVLIAPLNTSMSTTMVPTLSSSSVSTSSSLSSTLSPSSSTSSSTLSSPTTPTITTPSRSQRQKKSASTLFDYSPPANHIQTRTPWTPMEDDLLQKGYEQGLSWAMISATHLPHRSRGCCWGRFKTLRSKNLIDVKIQQQSRLARRAWKNMDIKKSHSTSLD